MPSRNSRRFTAASCLGSGLSSGLSEHLGVERGVVAGHTLKAEVLLNVPPTAPHHDLRRGPVAQKRSHPLAEALYVAVPHKEPRAGLGDQLAAAAVPADDDRRAAQQPLKRHEAEHLIR